MDSNLNKLVLIDLADLHLPAHTAAIVSLINEYRTDPMGGSLPPLRQDLEVNLIEGLRDNPCTLVFLACISSEIIGMAVCFKGFSTFYAKSLLNIHDLIVKKECRELGIGKSLLNAAADFANKNGYCKLTLEVRSDNESAQRLYRAIGFEPCKDPMEFWVCPI
jgi:ribosomal protein S18 acetylase RimI-like enzyme